MATLSGNSLRSALQQGKACYNIPHVGRCGDGLTCKVEIAMRKQKAMKLDPATKRAAGMEAVALRHCKHKVVPCAKKVESKSACRKWKGAV